MVKNGRCILPKLLVQPLRDKEEKHLIYIQILECSNANQISKNRVKYAMHIVLQCTANHKNDTWELQKITAVKKINEELCCGQIFHITYNTYNIYVIISCTLTQIVLPTPTPIQRYKLVKLSIRR